MYPNEKRSTRQTNAPPEEIEAQAKAPKGPKVRLGFVLPMLRLKELSRLLASRLERGEEIDFEAAVTVAAFSIEALRGMPQRKRGRHQGLDAASVNEWLRGVRIYATLEEIGDIIAPLDCRPDPNSPFRLNAALAGHMLRLTREERTSLEITTMEAKDETAEARKARKAAEKRERDRERIRAKRRAKAAREGRIIGGPTMEDRKPWIAAGVSRATWYRRQAGQSETGSDRETAASPTSIYKDPRQPCLTGDCTSLRDKSEASAIGAGRAKRPRTNAMRGRFENAPLDIPLTIEASLENVISIEAFRKDMRQAFASRAIALLEGSRVLLREQSARLDRDHAASKAGAAQARVADDREGAA